MKEDIDKILSDYLNNEPLTEEEKRLFNEWRHTSISNEKFGELVQKLKQQKKILNNRQQHTIVFEKIQQKVYRRRAKQRLILWSSCAAGIALLIGFFLLLQPVKEDPAQAKGSALGFDCTDSSTELTLPNGEKRLLNVKDSIVIVSDNAAEMRTAGKSLIVQAVGIKTKVPEYYTLHVPMGGEYNVVLSDGTKVCLNAGTTLRYPNQFTGKKREVFLDDGEAYFDVTPNPSNPFIVHTTDITIRVLGTSFNVNAYEDEAYVKTTLVEGAVEALCGDKKIIMAAGTQVVYNKDSHDTKYFPVDTRCYTSWKDGYYDFEEMTLDELMRIFSRWYNIKITFADPKLKTLKFSGRLKRYEDIAPLFDMLEYTRDVKFIEENGNIVIHKK